MTQHLSDLMLDQELADIRRLPPGPRRAAGIHLALRVAAAQGKGSLGHVEGVCVSGEALRMFVVRGQDGQLDVTIEPQPDLSWSLGRC